MKKIFLLPLMMIALFLASSCEDDSTNPLPEKVVGQYMKLDIDRYHRQMLYSDINNTYFGGILSNPGNTVVKFELNVRRTDGATGDVTADYVPLLTITSFPYDLKITPAMVAEALGLQLSDLKNGDFYRFYGYSYDANGNVATYSNLSSLNRSTQAMEQGYRFNTNLTDTPSGTGDNDEPYNNRVLN